MTDPDAVLKGWKLLDRYEIKARLVPWLLSCLPMMPGIAALGVDISLVALGPLFGGSVVVLWIGMTYGASAAGRRYERKLWPDWPHDAPTNRRLHPDDIHVSTQQKQLYYEAIRALQGIDIGRAIAEGSDQVEQLINDAVSGLRHRFRSMATQGLLAIHNEDYGFARNLAGLAVLWLPTSVVSPAVAWGLYLHTKAGLVWALIASIVLPIALAGAAYRAGFVRDRANRYAESFFGALTDMHRNHRMK